jgi:hypothetical protein
LDKSAKMIEPHLPEDALILYKYNFPTIFFPPPFFNVFHHRRAMEVVMIEDRPRQASEFASRAGRLLVKLGRYLFF